MTNDGHPISFGLSLEPEADRLTVIRWLARTTADGGLDYLAVQDHAYQPGHLDAWALHVMRAAPTGDLGFGTFVFWPMTASLSQLEVFSAEVVPPVRVQVDQIGGRR